jgi:hypothetical protein
MFQKRSGATPLLESPQQESLREPQQEPPLQERLRSVLREDQYLYLLYQGPWYCLVRLIMAAPRTGHTADTPWHKCRVWSETIRNTNQYTTVESLVQMNGPGRERKMYIFLLKPLQYLEIDILLNIHVGSIVGFEDVIYDLKF